MQVLGDELLRRAGQVDQAAAEVVGRRLHQVAIGAGQLRARVGRPEQQRRGEGRQRVQPERRARWRCRSCRRRRAAPRTAPGSRPSLARTERPSAVTSSTDSQVVAGEAELALEPARPAARGSSPATPVVETRPPVRRQPVRLRGAVEVAPGRAAPDGRACARLGQPRRAFMRRRSMIRPPSLRAGAGDAVAAAADSDLEPAARARRRARRGRRRRPRTGRSAPGRFSIIALKIVRASS